MEWIGSLRCALVLLLVGGGVAAGQGTLPATAPTSLPAGGVAAAKTGAPGATLPDAGLGDAVAGGAVGNVKHDVVVRLVGGKVEVVADGSSLNQVLREIGRFTGMKITGGVADEPVYGTYGPAPESEILSTLLDGTRSNMLLREATATRPGELILTPRTGGVTPPDPNAAAAREAYADPNVQAGRVYPQPGERWIAPVQGGGSADGTAAQPGSSPGQGERPNPQQIYQQLQRLQQSQQMSR